MAMPKRGPLEQIRKDTTKNSKDIIALKARIVDAESRLAKAETALGTIGKGGAPADAATEETAGDQQPETE